MHNLTHENYFSTENMMEYMSTSQFKAFEECESRALAEAKGEYKVDKDCFLEGHYFEACLNGEQAEELFLLQHPEMVCTRDTTRDGVKISSQGDIKSTFKKVVGAVKAFKRQPLFMDIINNCEKQVIVTCEIAGVKFKGCIDFLNMSTFDEYDTKAMKDFKKVYSEIEKAYVKWYFAYGYNYQRAIYKEGIIQTYGKYGSGNLLAVTKEETPDVDGLTFTDEIVNNALEIIKEFAPRYSAIKRGEIEPEPCGHCDYCKSNKIITEFEIVGEWE